MGDTNPQELAKAIEVFREEYGDKTQLDMFKLDEIITKLREKPKTKRNKK